MCVNLFHCCRSGLGSDLYRCNHHHIVENGIHPRHTRLLHRSRASLCGNLIQSPSLIDSPSGVGMVEVFGWRIEWAARRVRLYEAELMAEDPEALSEYFSWYQQHSHTFIGNSAHNVPREYRHMASRHEALALGHQESYRLAYNTSQDPTASNAEKVLAEKFSRINIESMTATSLGTMLRFAPHYTPPGSTRNRLLCMFRDVLRKLYLDLGRVIEDVKRKLVTDGVEAAWITSWLIKMTL
ncbi:hypothetical protein K7X08_030272 [Anisodus acutangulus]|uniref:Uncharacterized protein n=1 Tax=Anisodus acutangulus TaxID=402998 RepID=A0A9Q1R381_9SOLA|nr:hypothetical protein K7X08_030272 [Anisodus acutangulus]